MLSTSERSTSRHSLSLSSVQIHNPVEAGALLFYVYTYSLRLAYYFTQFVGSLLLPRWHFAAHRCSERSGGLTGTAVPLPNLATLFGFPAKSINQAWSGEPACARTVKSPHGAPVSTKTELCQAPPGPPAAESRQRANGARLPHICYGRPERVPTSPCHRGEGTSSRLPVPPDPHKQNPFPTPLRCISARPPPRQPQPPSLGISFLCSLPPSKHMCVSRAAFILQVKNRSRLCSHISERPSVRKFADPIPGNQIMTCCSNFPLLTLIKAAVTSGRRFLDLSRPPQFSATLCSGFEQFVSPRPPLICHRWQRLQLPANSCPDLGWNTISLPSPIASKASSSDSDFSPAAEQQPQRSYILLMLIYARPFKRPGEDRFHFIEINLDTRNYKDEGIQ